jgi:preprotein translocase subunit SecD
VKKSALWASLIGFVGLIAGLVGLNIGLGNTPVLGLDLKGGLSVIYATTEPADAEQLIIVRDLMRGQLESFGIAEPDVRVEGENIIVDLPGVSDQEAAFEALQVSGIVTLRPVLQCQAGVVTPVDSVPTVSGDSNPSSQIDPTVSTPTATTPGTTEEGALGAAAKPVRPLGFANPARVTPSTSVPSDTVPDTSAPETTVPTVPDTTVPVVTQNSPSNGQTILPYPGAGQTCLVGPSGGTGEVFVQGSAAAGSSTSTSAPTARLSGIRSLRSVTTAPPSAPRVSSRSCSTT